MSTESMKLETRNKIRGLNSPSFSRKKNTAPNERKVFKMEENTNVQKETMKQKAKAFYRKNKIVILAVGGAVAALGVSAFVKGKNRISNEEVEATADTNEQKEYGMEPFVAESGKFVLLVAETEDGWPTREEVAEDIKDGKLTNC